MAQTTGSASTSATTKEGVQIKGKDVILLNAPEVLLSPDTPLLTEAQDVAGAINELFMLDPGGGDGDFKIDPDWQIWEQLPEPGPYQAIYGVRIMDVSYANAGYYYTEYELNSSNKYEPVNESIVYAHLHFTFQHPSTSEYDVDYRVSYTIDWGDGTITSHSGGNVLEVSTEVMGADGWNGGANTTLKHRYTEPGLYIVTITLNDDLPLYGITISEIANNSNVNFQSLNAPRWIFAKIGSAFRNVKNNPNIKYMLGVKRHYKFLQISNEFLEDLVNANYDGSSSAAYAANCLQYLSTSLSKTLKSQFNGCYSLTEDGIDVKAAASVENNAFRECRSLRKLYLPNCTSIGDYAFYNCYGLKSIEAPNCTSIGASAFQNCFALHTLKVADSCTFGSNAFSNCYSLYPHPDGTL